MRTRGSTLVGLQTRFIHQPYASPLGDFRLRPSERLQHQRQAFTFPVSLLVCLLFSCIALLHAPYHSINNEKEQGLFTSPQQNRLQHVVLTSLKRHCIFASRNSSACRHSNPNASCIRRQQLVLCQNTSNCLCSF